MPPIGPQKRNPFTMVTPKAPPKLLSVKKKPPAPTVQGMVDTFDQKNKVFKKETAQKQKLAGELLQGMSDTVTQSFINTRETPVGEFGATVLANPNIEISDIKKSFPELSHMDDNVLGELGATVLANPNITIDQIKRNFPEIYELPKVQPKEKEPNRLLGAVKKGVKIISPIANVVDTIGAENIKDASLGVLSGVAKVGSGIGKTISRLDPTLSKENREKLFSDENRQSMATELARTVSPGVEKSGVFQGGQLAGELGANVALTYPVGGGAKGLGVLGKTLLGAGAGATQTQIANIASEGEFATAGETALGAGIGGVLGGGAGLLSRAKKGLYNVGFADAPKNVRKDLAKFGKTPGQAILDQNLPPNTKQGLVEIKSKLQNTRKKIEQTADTAGNIQGSTIKGGLVDDIIKKLGYDKLNKNATTTKSLINNVKGLVDDMIPNGKISGNELVQQIKQLNSTLPNSLMGRGFQDLKGNTKIQKVIEVGLKNALDDLATAGGSQKGTIQSLYQQYGKQKTVETILGNEEIKGILMRQLIGGGVGGLLGGSQLMNDIEKGDIVSGITKFVLFSLAGQQIGKLTRDPNFLMKLGNILEKGKKIEQPVRSGLSILSSKAK